MAARAAVGIGRLFVVLENRPRETQIVSDLIAGGIYVAAALAVVNFSFCRAHTRAVGYIGCDRDRPRAGLAEYAVGCVLGDRGGVGAALQPGDLLWIEGNIEGRVVQMNWRSTQIATGDNNIATVPNSIVAKSRMINRSAPTPIRRDTVALSLDPAAHPVLCLSALEAAMRACRIPLDFPAPSVVCTALKGDGVVYEISFSVRLSEELLAARSEFYGQAQRHLRHAGVGLGVVGLASVPAVPPPTPAQLLAESDLFSVMEEGERNALSSHFRQRWLEAGDDLMREGDTPDALFIVASGTAEIRKTGMTSQEVLYRVSPGESLGAVGLITGTPYSVTVTALTRLRVYELCKADLSAAIAIKPELAAGLEELAKRGQAALRRYATEHEKAQLAKPEVFLLGIRNFLHLLRS